MFTRVSITNGCLPAFRTCSSCLRACERQNLVSYSIRSPLRFQRVHAFALRFLRGSSNALKISFVDDYFAAATINARNVTALG